jgi:hypothetical protein
MDFPEMSSQEVTRLEVDDSRETPALDIPALEYGTREMAKNGEKAEILLTHPEETLIRGFAEKGTPRRFAPGGTVYHGDTECLHLAYPTDKGLTEFNREAKKTVEGLFSEVVDEDLYWYGRDLLASENGDPSTDPQVAGLAAINGKDYSIARTCATFSQNTDSIDQMIAEDGLTDPETYRDMNYFFEEEVGEGVQDYLFVDSEVRTVEDYLSDRGLAEESYRAARDLQERDEGIEPRSCVTGFRP